MISVSPGYRDQHPSLVALRVSFCACFYAHEVVGYQLPEGEKLEYKGPVMAQLCTAYPSPVCYDWFCPKHITPGFLEEFVYLKELNCMFNGMMSFQGLFPPHLQHQEIHL